MITKTRSGVVLHTPCEGCGNVSYRQHVDAPDAPNGGTHQAEVREYDGKLFCQPCLAEYKVTDNDGNKQLSMFD